MASGYDRLTRGLLCCVLALIVSACGDGASGGEVVSELEDPTVDEDGGLIDVAATEGCGLLQERHCWLPFPSNDYTVPDTGTDSGRRVALLGEYGPFNAGGDRPDFAEWNRSDGFSPGSPILVHAPGVDLLESGAPSITDLEHSLTDDSATLLIDTETGARHPHWAELNDRAVNGDPVLILRPARNFADGHTYIVAVRGLTDASGAALPVSPVFAAYRDALLTTNGAVEAQRARMEGVLETLVDAGLVREDLWLAWDFTVASTRSLSERVLTMRDDAFERLGESAPSFVVDSVQEARGGVRDRTSHYVYGSFEVPNYLEGDGEEGSRFNVGADGLPVVNPEQPLFTANFACIVPPAAVDGRRARPVVYGHGLLGSRYEVVEAWDIVLMTSEHNMVYCGTDWVGMTFGDAITIGGGLAEVGQFQNVPDRIQQGFLNFQFLARLLRHPEGFSSHEAFQIGGSPLLDMGEVFYDGNSQGGILGGAATAVSTQWTRGVLGVPGMNFGALLDRSRSFDQFRPVLDGAYEDPLERQIVLALIQMLWDRGEANGYANHLGRDPLPGTPEHQVLLHVGFGDFQVADVTAFIEARSFGAAVHLPILAAQRGAIDYGFGLDPIEYPWPGSAVILWDSGVDAPPLVNRPPRGSHDSHEDPRYDEDVRFQKSEFLSTEGTVIDVCEGPCTADRWG